MKAIGRNIIIKKTKEGTTKTKGGLLLAETHRDDIRYVEATVISSPADITVASTYLISSLCVSAKRRPPFVLVVPSLVFFIIIFLPIAFINS